MKQTVSPIIIIGFAYRKFLTRKTSQFPICLHLASFQMHGQSPSTDRRLVLAERKRKRKGSFFFQPTMCCVYCE